MNKHITSAQIVAEALGGHKSGNGWIARCPCHGDGKPSLSISDGAGTALVHCHAGCSQRDVIAELERRGLWQRKAGTAKKIIATYDYTDQDGNVLFQVCRFEPKDFRQRKPDSAGGWTWSVKGVDQVPYRLPEIAEAIASERIVFIVEGEKDADNLIKLGIPATCNAGGAGRWRDNLVPYFAGADVVLLPDNDRTGRDHANAVATKLKPVANRVRVLELPGLPPKGDVSDWIKASGTSAELYHLAEGAPDWNLETESKSGEAGKKINFAPYAFPDPATIPPRQWLYGRHYIRGAVTATIGAPGRAKSTASMTEIVGMAVGRDLLTGDVLPKGPLRAAYLNGEETQEELDRRVAAICQHYSIKPTDCGDRLWVISTRDSPIRVAVLGPQGNAVVDGDVVATLKEWCSQNRIDVLAIDPLISFHSTRESDNGDIDVVCKQAFGAIAGKEVRSVDLVHHPRKLPPGESSITVDDARGASALLSAVRLGRTLNFMTKAEAEQLGINEDDRRLHVKIENGKSNPGPIGKADWIKIEAENLPNGDTVACVVRWSPPDPFDGVTVADLKVVQKVVQGGAFRANSQSEEWLGWWMAKNLTGLNISARFDDKPRDRAAVDRLNFILKTWVKSDVLSIVDGKDEKRRPRKFYAVGEPAGAVLIAKTGSDELK
jgi:AAA domain